jgi:hypothetical protein
MWLICRDAPQPWHSRRLLTWRRDSREVQRRRCAHLSAAVPADVSAAAGAVKEICNQPWSQILRSDRIHAFGGCLPDTKRAACCRRGWPLWP